PAVAKHLVAMAAVAVDRNGQRAARDLVEVQGYGAGETARGREEPTAAVAGVRRVRDDTAVDQILPVRLELAEVGDETAGGAALFCGPSAARRVPVPGAAAGAPPADLGGDQSLPVHLDQRQADLEVLRDDLGLRATRLLKRDGDTLGAHHDIVDGQDEPRRIH